MNSPSTQVATTRKRPGEQKSLVARFAGKLGVDSEKMLATLRATAFKTGKNDAPVSNEEMLALLVVADQFNLNPFTKEIYAFRDQKGGIMPIIGVDGYIRLMNAQPTFLGISFKYSEEDMPIEDMWVEATITRKDRTVPITVREYWIECKRDTGPWKNSPKRMLRHRALVQCCRIAFGFGGIYEADEGEAIALATGVDLLPVNRGHVEPPQARTAEEPFVTEDQLMAMRERMGACGTPESLVLAKFEVVTLGDLRVGQVPVVLKFISDNGGPQE
jgi:phage recombination protein Bet